MSFSNTIARATFLLIFTALFLSFSACGGGGGGTEIRLQGAGATFPNPLYQKWLSEYG